MVILSFVVFSAVSLYFRQLKLGVILLCTVLVLLVCMKVTKQFPPLQSFFRDDGFILRKKIVEIDYQDSCLSALRSGNSDGSPESALSAALLCSISEAKSAMEALTKFTALSAGHREQIAIRDCEELLDLSVSELAWSLGEMYRIRAGGVRGFSSAGNMKAWLSAALSNQDTCLEGFAGTDRLLEKFVRGNLFRVNQLIANALAMYTQMEIRVFKPLSNVTEYYYGGGVDFRTTAAAADEMAADVVVAQDGSGQYQTIGDAIDGAPSYSRRKYVIRVKKGVYKENVDVKKRKTNILLVGDGIGKTVVTGDRNFLQGWTTFRTATFGN
ncbi:pectinesterase [Genlisea aurea]|uniref:Pectinesterase n=1 Tax=Genlisea aurea TaxID=192259 RepID=S8E9V6_9LAMI|nr:pectinesterase [Genlisea aurea]